MFEWIWNIDGWIGVGLGLACFGLGFFKGRYDREHMATLATIIIEDLVERRLIKTRRKWNQETQEWEVDLLEYDEE